MASNRDATPLSFAEIRDNVANINNSKIEIALKHAERVFEAEEKRRASVESKAFNLMGVAGVSATIIFALATFLLEKNVFSKWLAITTGILFLVMAISLIRCLGNAGRVVAVGTDSRPNPGDFLNLASQTENAFDREYIASLYYAYQYNFKQNNEKIDALLKAERSFQFFVTVLIVFAFLVFSQIALVKTGYWHLLTRTMDSWDKKPSLVRLVLRLYHCLN